MAQCDDILAKFPQGIDTVVGSKGVYLSGGETQRIAIARAILKNAPIIVLDEATAYADPENEQQIQQAFEGLTKGKTVIMIAHRLSTIQNKTCSSRNGLSSASVPGVVKTSMRAKRISTAGIVAVSS